MDATSQDDMSRSSKPYDIANLLRYSGPSLRREEPIRNAREILDFCDTEKNRRNIEILLSSQGIPFYAIQPSPSGWPGIRHRILVGVARSQYREAYAILTAAAEESAIDVVEGDEGLYAY